MKTPGNEKNCRSCSDEKNLSLGALKLQHYGFYSVKQPTLLVKEEIKTNLPAQQS